MAFVQFSQVSLAFGDRDILKNVSVNLMTGTKAALTGANGAGKSTLIKTMLGIIKPVQGTIEHDQFVKYGYFQQEENASDKTALQEIWDEFPAMTNAEVRAALARCGLTNEHITSQMRVLSGGENAKVRLCRLMLSEFNLLVLDEPTNHLDVLAKESLREAIDKFKGTVILVSHEPEFYEGIVTDIWNLENWTTKII